MPWVTTQISQMLVCTYFSEFDALDGMFVTLTNIVYTKNGFFSTIKKLTFFPNFFLKVAIHYKINWIKLLVSGRWQAMWISGINWRSTIGEKSDIIIFQCSMLSWYYKNLYCLDAGCESNNLIRMEIIKISDYLISDYILVLLKWPLSCRRNNSGFSVGFFFFKYLRIFSHEVRWQSRGKNISWQMPIFVTMSDYIS